MKKLFKPTAGMYDYNVGDEMKGQNVNPILELEIETDAILDASTGLAI